jgi:hypothetical protein
MNPKVISLNRIAQIFFQIGKGFFAVTSPVFKAYCDESSDEKQRDVLCVGTMLVHSEVIKEIEASWIDRLNVPDEIQFFRASSCSGVHGPFFKLRAKYGDDAQAVVNKLRLDLESILLSHRWVGFGLGILIRDYKEVWRSSPVAKSLFREDPTEAAYYQIFHEIAGMIQEFAPDDQVAFIVDDSTYSGKIAEAFRGFKLNVPFLAESVTTMAPFDDKITPGLQMADLVASVVRNVFLEWIATGKPELELKWHNHFETFGKWDKDHMRKSIEKTMQDPRYYDGQLARRTLPEPSARELKREEKQRRKNLMRALGLEGM